LKASPAEHSTDRIGRTRQHVVPGEIVKCRKTSRGRGTGRVRPRDKARRNLRRSRRRCRMELKQLADWVKGKGEASCEVSRGQGHRGQGRRDQPGSPHAPARASTATWHCPSIRPRKTKSFIQRYIAHFPAAGEIVLFDRFSGTTGPGEREWDFVPVRIERFLNDGPRGRAGG